MLLKFINKYKLYLVPLFIVIVSPYQPLKYIIVMFAFWLFSKRPRFIIDINLLFLLVFTIGNDIAINSGGPIGRTLGVIYPIALYIIGKYVTGKLNSEYDVILLVLSYIVFFNINPIVSYILHIYLHGFDFTGLKLLGSTSVNDYTSTTLYCSFFALNMSLFPILFIKKHNALEKNIKKISIVLMIIAFFVIGSIGQRTGFYILLFSLLSFVLFVKFKLLRVISVKNFIFVVLLFFSPTIISVDWLYETAIYKRFFNDDEVGIFDSRTKIWEVAIDEYLKNPLGDKNFEKLESGNLYAHNLWLDVGLRAGYLVLIPLIIFCILYLVNLLTLLKSPLHLITKMIFIFISIAFFSTFMVEPIMQGYFDFFCSFTFAFGVLSGVRSSTNMRTT